MSGRGASGASARLAALVACALRASLPWRRHVGPDGWDAASGQSRRLGGRARLRVVARAREKVRERRDVRYMGAMRRGRARGRFGAPYDGSDGGVRFCVDEQAKAPWRCCVGARENSIF